MGPHPRHAAAVTRVVLVLSLWLSQCLPTGAGALLTAVDGYPLDLLRQPQPGSSPAEAAYLYTPIPVLPLSARTVYRHWNRTVDSANALVVEGAGPALSRANVGWAGDIPRVNPPPPPPPRPKKEE